MDGTRRGLKTRILFHGAVDTLTAVVREPETVVGPPGRIKTVLGTQVRRLFLRTPIRRILCEISLNRFHAFHKKAIVRTFHEICVLSNVIFGAFSGEFYFSGGINASVDPIIEAITKFIRDSLGLLNHTIDKLANSEPISTSHFLISLPMLLVSNPLGCLSFL